MTKKPTIWQFLKGVFQIVKEDRARQKYLRENGLQAFLNKYRND